MPSWVTDPETGESVYVDDQGVQMTPPPEVLADEQALMDQLAAPEAAMEQELPVPAIEEPQDPNVLYSQSPYVEGAPPQAIGPGQTVNRMGMAEPKVEVGQETPAPPAVRSFESGRVTSTAAGRVPTTQVKPKGPKKIGAVDVESPELTAQQAAYDMAMNQAIQQSVMERVNEFYADPSYGPEVETAVKYVNDNFDPQTAMDLLDGVKGRVDQELQHLHSDIDNLMSQEINPNRIFANGSGVAAAIGVAVGAMSQAVLGPGTPNVAQQIVESALQRDMQAQRMELQRNQIGTGLRRDLVGLVRQRGLDDLAAFDYLQGYARKVAASQMAKYAARDPKMAIEAGKLMKDIQAKVMESMVAGNQKATAKGFEVTMNRRRNAVTESIARDAAQVASPEQTQAFDQPAPPPRQVRPVAQARPGVSKAAVAGKRRPAPAAAPATQAASIEGIPPEKQELANQIFNAVESTGLGSTTIGGKTYKLFKPIKSVGGYRALRNSWDIPLNEKKLFGADKVPLQGFQEEVSKAADTVADQRHMINLNRKLANFANIALQNDAARLSAYVSENEAEIFRTIKELGVLAKADAFKRSMDGDTEAESMARASNLDVETITALKGGPGAPGFAEAKDKTLKDIARLISPAEIDGWNRAINRRNVNIVDKLQRKAPTYGVELTPFFTESLESVAEGAGK